MEIFQSKRSAKMGLPSGIYWLLLALVLLINQGRRRKNQNQNQIHKQFLSQTVGNA
jgi:hypothetical protein